MTDTSLHSPSPVGAFEHRALRSILGRFVTGVTVVTTRLAEGAPVGVTINSFTSVSLDPPLVLFCLSRAARSLENFRRSGIFAVNMLASDQKALSRSFAGGTPDWQTMSWTTWMTGAPIIDGCAAAIECKLYAIYDGGDHEIFVGQILDLEESVDASPLVYHRGAYARLTPDCEGE